MTGLTHPDEWTVPSSDPNDEQFGDVVERASLADADDYDAVLVGEPYDGAVIGRRGAREGPAALRDALAATKTHHFDAGPVADVADLGDVDVPADEGVAAVQDAVQSATEDVHESDAVPVFLGGDNSLTVPNAAPLLDAGSLGIVNFDAHLDCRELRDGPTSGTPYRQLHEAGLDAYSVVGARHFETSTAYADYLRERDGEVVTSEEVGDDVVSAVDSALAGMDVDALYVSVDLDVLDAAAAPGVSAPTPGGLTTRELFRALRLVASSARRERGGPQIVGFEVVECAPPLDEGDRTARAGARAIAHFLAALGGGR
ncbi:formimidoylglutamase [Halomicrococcus gelatinilyticus]|uniref:formimidoylglutamase n=1 Tax=Halomicrococcus gelatinilyticus TaxID=1702103 RepID=UPI002E142059